MSRWFATGVCVALFSILVASAASAQSSDLFVTKTSPASASEGSDITYTVDIGNVGPDDAPNATLTDTLPATGKFVSESQTSGPIFSCTKPPADTIGGTVTCTIASFASGATAEFSIVISAPTGTAGTTLINSAKISSDNADDNPENNTAFSGTTISGGNLADIGVSKTGPASAVPGSSVTFTITVTNFGPNDSGKVTLNDTLGAGFSGMTVTLTSGAAFSCPGNTTPCTIDKLTNGSSATFSLVTTISSTPGTYTNTASVTSPNDPTSENDSSQAAVIASSSDVGVTKTAPATAVAGATFTYSVTLSNSGPDTADTASFNDALPAGILFVSVSQSIPAGSTASCTGPPLDQNGTVACEVSPLLNGETATFTITVEADPSTPNGTVVNNTAVASSNTPDPNGNNNTSSAMTTISANADVSVTKSGPASVTAGTAVTYTITVTNAGPSNASSVTMTDALPAGTTFNSLTQTSGPSFTCTTGATVTCSIATLLATDSATFQLVANVSPSVTGGTITNTATVVSTTPDSTPGNNSSPSTASVATSADLAVLKTGPASGFTGTSITYTITATNNGPSDAQTVSLADTLPAGVTFVSFNQSSGPAFTCGAPSGGTVTCTIATFAAGANAVFSLIVSIPPATPAGTLTNTATIASATSDSKPANNTSSVMTTVSANADLAITKTGPARVIAFTPATFTISVVNNGPSPADNVVVNDTLPAGFTFISATPSQGTCNSTSPVVCSVGTLASGGTATITIVAEAGAPTTGVTNTATVSSSTPDNNPANNTSTTPAFDVVPTNNIPAASPLGLMLLAMMLAIGGAIVLRK